MRATTGSDLGLRLFFKMERHSARKHGNGPPLRYFLVRRFGPRRLLALSVIWWGVFTAVTAFVPPGVRGASDWLARHVSLRAGRCILPAIALAGTAVLLLIGSRAEDARVASAVLACGAGALYLSQSCFWSVSADFAGEFAGVVSGTMNMGCQIGGAVTASLTPLIASHFGWQASFLAATVLAVLSALAWLAVNPHARLAAAVGSGRDLRPLHPELRN